jgi:hypothetical protein
VISSSKALPLFLSLQQEKSFFFLFSLLYYLSFSFFLCFRGKGSLFYTIFFSPYSILRVSGVAAVTVERQSRRFWLQPSLTQPTPANSRQKRTKESIDTKRLIDFSRNRIHLTRAQLFFTLFSLSFLFVIFKQAFQQ